MVIVLCGFMGCGKTTMLRRLSSAQDWSAFDLDDKVFEDQALKREKALVEVIDRIGWDAFRRAELEVLEKLLTTGQSTQTNLLISLGGGALRGETLSLIKSLRAQGREVYLVWLKTPFAQCWERIHSDLGRPLVRQGREKAEELYNERVMLYELSDYTLDESEQDQVFHPEELLKSDCD